jgi:hypothetical protein
MSLASITSSPRVTARDSMTLDTDAATSSAIAAETEPRLFSIRRGTTR